MISFRSLRRISFSGALVVALSLGVAGCGEENTQSTAPSPSGNTSSPTAPNSWSTPTVPVDPNRVLTPPAANAIATTQAKSLVDQVKVTGEFGKTPTVAIPQTKAPTVTQVKVLKEGTGAPVKAGQTIPVFYHGMYWNTPPGADPVFDSSFLRNDPYEATFGVGQFIAAWDENVVGKKIGSRLLIVATPDKAYGYNPAERMAGYTLVFVVDLLTPDSTATTP